MLVCGFLSFRDLLNCNVLIEGLDLKGKQDNFEENMADRLFKVIFHDFVHKDTLFSHGFVQDFPDM